MRSLTPLYEESPFLAAAIVLAIATGGGVWFGYSDPDRNVAVAVTVPAVAMFLPVVIGVVAIYANMEGSRGLINTGALVIMAGTALGASLCVWGTCCGYIGWKLAQRSSIALNPE
eukprot:NODE_4987_length_734_cov_51.405272_g4964_i0.p1 GENE.NODE_4987_length_734_cov_51.405272_g4964_i0~~NODE_4987_length_734_cov_51.405272_g4964_i0.p1  ORF type:complete len:115 (+),score=5.25 NODE_4987_length_734_cov_51.405272_g4964_i0:341-685(+)